MQMFTGPSCQEASTVYLTMDAAYGPQKEYVNLPLGSFGPTSYQHGVGGAGWAAQKGNSKLVPGYSASHPLP